MDTFDYIIVGAGSAGSALAAKLTEDASLSVLLLEAGGEDSHRYVNMPLGMGRMLTDPQFVWPFSTEPEPELKGQRVFWPRGRLLGGSSSVNGMLFVRGAAHRYDEWRDGNEPGWGFDELLPHFKAIEDRTGGDAAWRGRGGPVTVSDAPQRDALSAAFYDACVEAGARANDDYNGAHFDGVGWLQYNIRRGRRWSAARAYLDPAKGRPNLTVLTRAQASRLEIRDDTAVGVHFLHNGEERFAAASGEVLLSAGPIISPALLERSGIGDPEVLSNAGIGTVHALPGVGTNLQDHLQNRVTFESTIPVTINDILNNPVRGALEGLRYVLFKKGLLASSSATVHAIVRSESDLPHPDIKLQIMLTSGKDRYARSKKVGLDKFSGFNIGAFQLYPHSRGSVHIASPDPGEAPTIHANYLSDPRDVTAVLKAFKMARSLAKTPVLAALIRREVRPGPEVVSDDAVLDYIRETSQTSWHPIGTCRMGRGPGDVVDHQLRVHGIGRLRVIDSSIMPNMPTSNTNAPSIMIGLKGAELVLAERA
jgi:choline dehydrogenase